MTPLVGNRGIIGAFLKTQRHKYLCPDTVNICLLNLKITLFYLEEPVRVASPHRINLEEPVRVASTTRINLEEPVRVASPTRRNSFLCQSVRPSVSKG
jgi:hypothetical protein